MPKPSYADMIRRAGLTLKVIGYTWIFYFKLLPFKSTTVVKDLLLDLQGIYFKQIKLKHSIFWFKLNLDIKINSTADFIQTNSKYRIWSNKKS